MLCQAHLFFVQTQEFVRKIFEWESNASLQVYVSSYKATGYVLITARVPGEVVASK